MKIPIWAKILWWIVLLGLFAFLFGQRYSFIIKGNTTSTDVVILLVFIAVLVIPLFQEFSIFGISFKKELDNVKKDIEKQIVSLQADIKNTINIYPNGVPPSDAELPNLRKVVDEAVRDAIKDKTVEHPGIEDFKTPDDTLFLFSVRYQLEKAIRQIYIERGEVPNREPMYKLLSLLVDRELISRKLYESIREVNSICAVAIHGEDVSEAKINFVRDVATELISSLETIASYEMEHKS